MDVIIPRYDLPDNWAGKGACPVCRVRGRLAVVHQTVTPDHMWCGACDAAFEVESGGAHMRLVRPPVAVVASPPGQLLERWVLPSELTALLAEPDDLAAPGVPPAAESALAPEAPPAADPSAPEEDADAALTTALNLPARAKLNAEIRELLYGPDDPEPVAGHAVPAAEPPAPDEAETLLAGLFAAEPVAKPAVSGPPPGPVIEMPEAAPTLLAAAAPTVESAALLSALLSDLPASFAPAATDEAEFLDSLVAPPAAPAPAQAALAPTAVESTPSGDAALLLAQLLDDLPATVAPAPTDEAQFLDALAAGAVTADQPSAAAAGVAGAPTQTERGLTAAADGTVAVPEIVIIVPEPPDPAILAARALQLFKLGNPLALIEAALQRTGATSDQIATAMREVRAQDQQRLARHARTYRVMGGIGLVLVLLLIVVGVVSAMRPGTNGPDGPDGTPGPTVTPGGPTLTPSPAYNPIIGLINLFMPSDVKIVNGDTPTPGPTSEILSALFPPTATPLPETATALAATSEAALATAAAGGTSVVAGSSVPDWILALVPADLDVTGAPVPSVDQSGPPRADCPFSAELAAALFGGNSLDWHYVARENSWYLTAFDKPITARLPLNMAADYLVLGVPLTLHQAIGPATITHISFIMIRCSP